MIVDSSAIVAIAYNEPECAALVAALTESVRLRMSAATYVEAGIVLDSSGIPEFAARLDRLLGSHDIHLVDVTEAQARIARRAYRDFGRGSGHRARLNYGDCFSYALAIDTDEPLLFKGDDFAHTDVRRVAW